MKTLVKVCIKTSNIFWHGIFLWYLCSLEEFVFLQQGVIYRCSSENTHIAFPVRFLPLPCEDSSLRRIPCGDSTLRRVPGGDSTLLSVRVCAGRRPVSVFVADMSPVVRRPSRRSDPATPRPGRSFGPSEGTQIYPRQLASLSGDRPSCYYSAWVFKRIQVFFAE